MLLLQTNRIVIKFVNYFKIIFYETLNFKLMFVQTLCYRNKDDKIYKNIVLLNTRIFGRVVFILGVKLKRKKENENPFYSRFFF